MNDDPSKAGERGGRVSKKPARRPESYLPEALRALPQSLDAEKGVLGSILLSPTTVLDECIKRQVGPKYFHLPAHALIFSALVEMQEKRKPIDLISLTQFLEDTKRLEYAGGAVAVTELFTFVPTATNASYYLEIVREKYLLRQIIATCTEYAARAYDEQNEVPVLLNEVEKKVLLIGRDRFSGVSKTIKSLALGALESVEKLFENRGALTGLASGFKGLDDITNGLQKSEMIVIAARPSMGKTALAKELKVPIIVLAQLNRNPDARPGATKGKPNLSDLRESGAIEQDADLVGLLWREAYYLDGDEKKEAEGKADLIIAKHRNGEVGTIPLTFLAPITRFEDRAPDGREPSK
jgi:replicative DNA helicase